MTDSPIYDALRQGVRPVPRVPHFAGHLITIPLEHEAAQALFRWHENHHVEIAAVLAPFGVHPYDIAEPTYRRVARSHELLTAVDARADIFDDGARNA